MKLRKLTVPLRGNYVCCVLKDPIVLQRRGADCSGLTVRGLHTPHTTQQGKHCWFTVHLESNTGAAVFYGFFSAEHACIVVCFSLLFILVRPWITPVFMAVPLFT